MTTLSERAASESLSEIPSELEGQPSGSWRHDAKHPLTDELLELIAARFRLLGEPVRLKLLSALAEAEHSVGELVALTGAGQPNVSKHLAALAQGGLVRRRKVGTTTWYGLVDPSALTLCEVVCTGLQEQLLLQAQVLGVDRKR
jgi:DNA-binding transcriptional ArsR family regulator